MSLPKIDSKPQRYSVHAVTRRIVGGRIRICLTAEDGTEIVADVDALDLRLAADGKASAA